MTGDYDTNLWLVTQGSDRGGTNADQDLPQMADEGLYKTHNNDPLHGVTVKWPIPINKVEARKALKRSNSLEMIIINSEKKDLLDDEFESGEDEDKVSMLLNSKARKKSKYMTTESVRKWN